MQVPIPIQPLVLGTPLEDHLSDMGLLVKREDLSCPAPGPPFSKMRGVYSHIQKKVSEGVRVFGVLDTSHSQAGHAVAYACTLLKVECVNFFPVYQRDVSTDPVPGDVPVGAIHILNDGVWTRLRDPQLRSQELGASLVGLKAGRSAVLYHQAKRMTEELGGYIMPNALKLEETVEETAAEVIRTFEKATREQYEVMRRAPWIVSCSSATIASGVMKGLDKCLQGGRRVILHMGYSRSSEAVKAYINMRLGREGDRPWPYGVEDFVNEGYAYADQAKPGPTPPWPCNPYYDLKALRWWLREGREKYGQAVFWNVG